MSSWISSLIDLVGTGTQLAYDIHDRERNYAHQMQAYSDYRSDIAIQRQREDSAMQRHVADLKAAGLNPALAAGTQGAASHAPQQGSPPKRDPMQILSVIAAKEQISMSRAERERIKAQTENIREDTDLKIEQAKHYGAQALYTGTQNEYFRSVMGFRKETEERANRIAKMLEQNTIDEAVQRLKNLELEGEGQSLKNILYQQQQTINSLQSDLLRKGITEKEISVQRQNIALFIERETADIEISRQAHALLNGVLIDQLLIENMEFELEKERYNLEQSQRFDVRTGEARAGTTSGGLRLGIPKLIEGHVNVRRRHY